MSRRRQRPPDSPERKIIRIVCLGGDAPHDEVSFGNVIATRVTEEQPALIRNLMGAYLRWLRRSLGATAELVAKLPEDIRDQVIHGAFSYQGRVIDGWEIKVGSVVRNWRHSPSWLELHPAKDDGITFDFKCNLCRTSDRLQRAVPMKMETLEQECARRAAQDTRSVTLLDIARIQ